VGQAFSFDGVNDYVGIPNVVDSWSAGTIALWVNFKDATPKDSGIISLLLLLERPASNGGDGTNFGIHKAAGNDLRFGIWFRWLELGCQRSRAECRAVVPSGCNVGTGGDEDLH